ncbi:hypothetical protein PCLA_05f0335 [Pseudomonas citronellolis]|nr:hypothetical protein PCLA_05f0335 [Pseudomonas citronellolis]
MQLLTPGCGVASGGRVLQNASIPAHWARPRVIWRQNGPIVRLWPLDATGPAAAPFAAFSRFGVA